MKILILGAGKMGSFFCDILSFNHDVAVYDRDPQRLRFLYNCRRFASLDEVDAFDPDMVLNAATVRYTLDAFRQVLPHIRRHCIRQGRPPGLLRRDRTPLRVHPPHVRPHLRLPLQPRR